MSANTLYTKGRVYCQMFSKSPSTLPQSISRFALWLLWPGDASQSPPVFPNIFTFVSPDALGIGTTKSQRKGSELARQKKDNSIMLDAKMAAQVIDWQAFITETAGMNFVGLKLVPNDDGEYSVAHAIGEDAVGTKTEFTETHRKLLGSAASANVTQIKAG